MIGYSYQWVEVNFEGHEVSEGISISARTGDSRARHDKWQTK